MNDRHFDSSTMSMIIPLSGKADQENVIGLNLLALSTTLSSYVALMPGKRRFGSIKGNVQVASLFYFGFLIADFRLMEPLRGAVLIAAVSA